MQCIRCAREFERTSHEVARGRTKFCSRTCSDAYKKESAQRYALRVLRAGRKQCKCCQRTRKLTYFPKSKRSATGYNSYCYDCTRAINREQDRKRYDRRREYSRNRHLIRTFGITLIEYNVLLEKQGGGCAICGKLIDNGRSLAVDHDNKTGRIRGVLCANCNRAIGQFAHDPARLQNAINYLS